jgi:hypothetical protein
MHGPMNRFTAAAAVAIVAAAVCGCGASAARPDPTPVSTMPTEHVPAPPHLPADHPAGATFVLDLTDQAAVQPATVDFEEHGTLEDMHWSHWGAAVADGHGKALVRVCNPSCVGGYTVSYPVTVTLSNRASCFGARFYGDSSIVADTRRGPYRLDSFIRNPCASG